MDYFSKQTIKFKPVATVPLWLLYGATISALLIVCVAWYFLLFGSLSAYHDYYSAQLPKLRETIKQLEYKKNNTAQLKKKVLALKTDQTQAMHEMVAIDDRIQQVFDLINNKHLSLISFVPDKEINKKWYSKRAVNYTLQGSYADVLSFFEELSQSGLCVQCKQLTINKIDDGLLQATALFDFIEFKA